jgi:hypothetical protein
MVSSLGHVFINVKNKLLEMKMGLLLTLCIIIHNSKYTGKSFPGLQPYVTAQSLSTSRM